MKRTVLVTGCFDILHPAHHRFLKKAKQQGDFLIVGLETDKRIKQLKGNARPVNSLRKRIANIKKIKAVDKVFALPKRFSSFKDHLQLLKKIKPDVLAVSENSPHLQKKKRMIKKIGGRLFIFPHDQRFSTSKLIKGS